MLCRSPSLFSDAMVAIDASEFKAVNSRDKNFTDRKLKAQTQQLEDSIQNAATLRKRTKVPSSRCRSSQPVQDGHVFFGKYNVAGIKILLEMV